MILPLCCFARPAQALKVKAASVGGAISRAKQLLGV